jgi:hypothetical protein
MVILPHVAAGATIKRIIVLLRPIFPGTANLTANVKALANHCVQYTEVRPKHLHGQCMVFTPGNHLQR